MKKQVILLLCSLFFVLAGTSLSVHAGPLKGKTVVVDPGHGGYDPGAVCEGALEKDINLEIALKLKKMLEESGARVILTRSGDYDLAAAGIRGRQAHRSDLEKRLEIARRSRADIMLSIHANSFDSPVSGGPEVFYHPGSKKGRLLAECVQSELHSIPGVLKRDAKASACLVISNSRIPSVLIEVGFLSNPAERKKLLNSRYQSLLAEKITKAITGSFSCPTP